MARKPKLPKKKKIKEKTPIVWKIHDRGWTAEIIKSEEDDGWAVTMTRDGDDAPVYMGPWTMGRDKINPKPMDKHAFNTWVKSATEFLARSQYQVRTSDRTALTVYTAEGEELNIIFDIDRGDYESEGVLVAEDVLGSEVARCSTYPRFSLTIESAQAWVESGFAPPPPPEERVQVAEEEDAWDPDSEEEDDDEPVEPTYEEEYVEEYEEPVYTYD